MKKWIVWMLLLVGSSVYGWTDDLCWSADTESGAPNVYYQDEDCLQLVGFETDIVTRMGEVLGCEMRFQQNDWDGLVPGLQRGLCDFVVNGFSPDALRGENVLFTEPYYACQVALVVQKGNDQFHSVLDCNHKVIGALKNSKEKQFLTENLKSVEIVDYQNEYCALADLANGRVDAVILDVPIAEYYLAKAGNLEIVDRFGEVYYAAVVAHDRKDLVERLNEAIKTMKKDGSLEAIIQKWHIDNVSCQELLAKQEMQSSLQGTKVAPQPSRPEVSYWKMLPFFGKAACVTLFVSLLSMLLAIVLGLCLAIVRMYMPKWISIFAVAIIEIVRGTPLLIQLFFVFYGLPCIGIRFSPIVAGIFTLGINYAAYESENFRAGLTAVPYGQMEAARALGMTQWQALRHVILPQAVTFIVPPLTNDFISLIKDSSLASLITIVELTKAYTLAASYSFNYFGTGLMVAFFYLLIGIPFVRIAKIAEIRLKLEKRAYNSKRTKRSYHCLFF